MWWVTVPSESEEVRDASVENESFVAPVASLLNEDSETPLVSVLIEERLAEEVVDESEEREEELSPVAVRESRFDDLFFALDWGGQSVRIRTRSMTAER